MERTNVRRYLTVTIDLEGAALSNPDTAEQEAQRILGVAADRVGRLIGASSGQWLLQGTTLSDVNGNRVGEMEVEER